MDICTRRRTGRCGTVWTAFTRRPTMPSRPRRGPDVDQERNERRRLRDRDALPCWVGWWACQDLNLRPHPYQQNAGNRCADRPFPRSRPTVEAKGMRSIGPLVCVLTNASTPASLAAAAPTLAPWPTPEPAVLAVSVRGVLRAMPGCKFGTGEVTQTLRALEAGAGRGLRSTAASAVGAVPQLAGRQAARL